MGILCYIEYPGGIKGTKPYISIPKEEVFGELRVILPPSEETNLITSFYESVTQVIPFKFCESEADTLKEVSQQDEAFVVNAFEWTDKIDEQIDRASTNKAVDSICVFPRLHKCTPEESKAASDG